MNVDRQQMRNLSKYDARYQYLSVDSLNQKSESIKYIFNVRISKLHCMVENTLWPHMGSQKTHFEKKYFTEVLFSLKLMSRVCSNLLPYAIQTRVFLHTKHVYRYALQPYFLHKNLPKIYFF